MSNLMKELDQLKAVRDRENAEDFDRLVKAAARGEQVDAAQAALTLERNGVSIEEFQQRVALTKKRMSWAIHLGHRGAAQARVDELTRQIDEANEAMLREHKERGDRIREMLRQRAEEQVPIDQANAAEAELRATFPGKARLDELSLGLSRGAFATPAERQKAAAEIESLEKDALLP